MPYTANHEQSVINRIAELGYAVYETELPENVQVTMDDFGSFDPFYDVVFGSPTTIRTERSLCGVEKDPYRVYFVAYAFAGDTDTLRTRYVALFNQLSGWHPTDSGEIKPEFGRYYEFGANEVRPTLYGRGALFSYTTNISLS